MLTPTEKFIFSTGPRVSLPRPFPPLIYVPLDFILLVLISLLVTAATMYLPNHVSLIYNRVWFYVHGEYLHLKGSGSEVLKTPEASTAVSVSKRKMAETAETVMRKLDEL